MSDRGRLLLLRHVHSLVPDLTFEVIFRHIIGWIVTFVTFLCGNSAISSLSSSKLKVSSAVTGISHLSPNIDACSYLGSSDARAQDGVPTAPLCMALLGKQSKQQQLVPSCSQPFTTYAAIALYCTR